MLKLGNLIKHDVFILEDFHLTHLSDWKINYEYHLINNEFKFTKIGFPSNTAENIIQEVIRFIQQLNIGVETFAYQILSSEMTLYNLINNHGENKTLHILPNPDVEYKKLGSEFWEFAVKGFEIIFYKADRLKECQKNNSTFKRYSNKGVVLGYTGSPKYNFGLLHKWKLEKLSKDGIIDFWISETTNTKDNHYLTELKIKTEILHSKMQKN